MRKSMLAAVAAVAMIGATSGTAVAQSAAPLSIASMVRTDAGTNEASDLRGGFILPTLAILAIIGVILLVTKNGSPSSP